MEHVRRVQRPKSHNVLSKTRECPITGKRRYADYEMAKDALTEAKYARHMQESENKSSRRREVRAYLCDFCLGWHLTSRETWIL